MRQLSASLTKLPLSNYYQLVSPSAVCPNHVRVWPLPRGPEHLSLASNLQSRSFLVRIRLCLRPGKARRRGIIPPTRSLATGIYPARGIGMALPATSVAITPAGGHRASLPACPRTPSSVIALPTPGGHCSMNPIGVAIWSKAVLIPIGVPVGVAIWGKAVMMPIVVPIGVAIWSKVTMILIVVPISVAIWGKTLMMSILG